jgi:hypothetical protein
LGFPQAFPAATEDADEQETPAAPENLITTTTYAPTPPGWKDVPDGKAALLQEGCKQQPGHSADTMREFVRQFVWTTAMVKGLIAGMAESKDGALAMTRGKREAMSRWKSMMSRHPVQRWQGRMNADKLGELP